MWGLWPVLRRSNEDSGLAPSTFPTVTFSQPGALEGSPSGVGGGIKDVSFRVRYLGLPLVGSVTQEGVFTSLWLSFLCENGSAVVLAVLVTLE